MHLLLIGCEYAGKKTLAVGISRWMIAAMGLPFVRWHDHYYADAVYAPLYYGYGEPDSFADRRRRARDWDRELLLLAPDTVLLLVTASADAVREPVRRSPRAWDMLKDKDVSLVLDRFQEEYDRSLLHHKFTLDTTSATAGETLRRFLEQIPPLLSHTDRRRMADHGQ